MKLGIIGFPASGKTTIFNAITGSDSPVGTYSGMPGVRPGQVVVPDARLNTLRDMYQPKKFTPAQYDCLDITGLVTGSGSRHEFDPKVLNDVKQCDALVFVLRAFDNDEVPHPRGGIDPDADFETARMEMLFADLSMVENRIEKLKKQIQRFSRNEDRVELTLFSDIQDHLESEKPLRDKTFSDEQLKTIRGYQFLTLKPWIKVYNVGEDLLGDALPNPTWDDAQQNSMAMCGRLEMEIAQMDDADRTVFLKEMGINTPGAQRLAHLAYQALGLASFFTVGKDEVRAWTIHIGDTALTAAGCIHSDLARGFIRAETVAYADLAELGDMKAVKAAGRFRLEGKTYPVQDGDILMIRFNV